MENDRCTEEFLDLYRRLENAAEALVGEDSRGSSVYRLERHRDFAAHAEQIACYREVRNFLTHEPKFRGEYAIHPSEAMVEGLRQLLETVENPPRIRTRMTPIERLITAERGQPLLPLMRKMAENHLSHVPILENGRVDSVFSVETLFQAALAGKQPGKDAKVGDLGAFLPLDRHLGQEFRFADPDMPLREARALFDSAYRRNRKLKLLLVTQGADPEAPLLGVVSPYDLMRGDGA